MNAKKILPPKTANARAVRSAVAAGRSTNATWTTVLLSLVVLLVIGVAVYAVVDANRDSTAAGPSSTGSGQVVRQDSHRLSTATAGTVTLVEFLDFECEACLASFPTVEKIRADYAGKITVVARYFPLDGHFNARRAAWAVEAAAQQGKFEQMYTKMYQTQTTWSEQQVPKDDVFRGFAKDLGLDMAKWDADYASDKTKARVQRDVDDGTTLGVQGTPTFFLNGQLLQPESPEDLTKAIDDALAES